MVIEVLTFRLAPGVHEEAFLEADRRMQTEFIYTQEGIVRRTTARGDDGDWLVLTLWWSAEAADETTARAADHEAAVAFTALLDPASVRRYRYTTLD